MIRLTKKSGQKDNIRSFGPGVVVYPNGTIIRPEDWSSGNPVGTPIEGFDEPDYPDVGGINPNPKYYVTPKDGSASPGKKIVKVKVKKKA